MPIKSDEISPEALESVRRFKQSLMPEETESDGISPEALESVRRFKQSLPTDAANPTDGPPQGEETVFAPKKTKKAPPSGPSWSDRVISSASNPVMNLLGAINPPPVAAPPVVAPPYKKAKSPASAPRWTDEIERSRVATNLELIDNAVNPQMDLAAAAKPVAPKRKSKPSGGLMLDRTSSVKSRKSVVDNLAAARQKLQSQLYSQGISQGPIAMDAAIPTRLSDATGEITQPAIGQRIDALRAAEDIKNQPKYEFTPHVVGEGLKKGFESVGYATLAKGLDALAFLGQVTHVMPDSTITDVAKGYMEQSINPDPASVASANIGLDALGAAATGGITNKVAGAIPYLANLGEAAAVKPDATLVGRVADAYSKTKQFIKAPPKELAAALGKAIARVALNEPTAQAVTQLAKSGNEAALMYADQPLSEADQTPTDNPIELAIRGLKSGQLTAEQSKLLTSAMSTKSETIRNSNLAKIALLSAKIQGLAGPATDWKDKKLPFLDKVRGFVLENVQQQTSSLTAFAPTMIRSAINSGRVGKLHGGVASLTQMVTTYGGSYDLALSEAFANTLSEAGIDLTNEASLRAAFKDPALYAKARSIGNRNGIGVGIFDGIAAGVAGRMFGYGGANAFAKMLPEVTDIAIQGALGGTGSIAGSLMSGRPVNWDDVRGEVLGEVFPGVGQMIIGGASENRNFTPPPGPPAVSTNPPVVTPPVVAPSVQIADPADQRRQALIAEQNGLIDQATTEAMSGADPTPTIEKIYAIDAELQALDAPPAVSPAPETVLSAPPTSEVIPNTPLEPAVKPVEAPVVQNATTEPVAPETAAKPISSAADFHQAWIDTGRYKPEEAHAMTALAEANRKYHGETEEQYYPRVWGEITGGGKASESAFMQEMAPQWYSKLERTIAEKMGKTMPPDQLRSMLNAAGVKSDEMKFTGFDEWLDKQGDRVSKQDALRFLQENQVQVQEVYKDQPIAGESMPPGMTATKFFRYQTPGGENYRELLLTLPEKPKVSVAELEIAANEHYGKSYRELNPAQKDNAAAYVRDTKGQGVTSAYKSAHWDEPNVLAHVRWNDRTGANGEKILHIEEIQSDWHQAGRDKGYRDNAAITNEIAYLEAQRTQLFKDAEPYTSNNQDAPPAITDKYTAVMERIQSLKNKMTNGVPQAPFSKTWHELAMKKILRYAAENGYDRVTWTTGEQQAARYDLSKQVDSIGYGVHPDGTTEIHVYKDGIEVITEKNLSDQKLADTIGKELAQKIKSDWQTTGYPAGTLEGLDLKVGGEGMKGFYDKILPAAADKLTKRWGGKTGKGTLKTDEYGYDVKANRYGSFNVLNADRDILRTLPTEMEARRWAQINGESLSNISVHTLDVTPAMRSALLSEGQPLFQTGAEGVRGSAEFNAQGQAIVRAFQSADISTGVHEIAHVFLEGLKPEDRLAVESAYGAKEGLTRKHHEQFADGFIRFLREGTAPTEALRSAFSQFKKWLTDIYSTIKGTPLEEQIHPDVRTVYEKMLGKTDAPVAETAAKKTAEVAVKLPPMSTEIVKLDPGTIVVDPEMQWKKTDIYDNKAMVTNEYKNVREYNTIQGGVHVVWQRNDGVLVEGHGHHRLDIANRAERFVREVPGKNGNIAKVDQPREIDAIILREADGWTKEMVSDYSALLNIRDGKGTAIDAVPVIRRFGYTREDLKAAGVSPQSKMFRNITGLQRLSDDAINAVRNQHVSEDVAAGIGEMATDPNMQRIAIASANAAGLDSYKDGLQIGQRIVKDVEARTPTGQMPLWGDIETDLVDTGGIQVRIQKGITRRAQAQRAEIAKPISATELDGEIINRTLREELANSIENSSTRVEGKMNLVYEFDTEVQNAIREAAKRVTKREINESEAIDITANLATERAKRSVSEIIAREVRSELPQEKRPPAQPQIEVAPVVTKGVEPNGKVQGQAQEVVAPRVMTFDEFSIENGVDATPPSMPELHRAPGGVSKPSAKGAATRQAEKLKEWDAARSKLLQEYNRAIDAGSIRPPTNTEQLQQIAARGTDTSAIAQRVLDRRQARLSGQAQEVGATEVPRAEADARILAIVSKATTSVEDIIAQSKLPAPVVSGTLTILEMKEQVRRLPGNTYEIAKPKSEIAVAAAAETPKQTKIRERKAVAKTPAPSGILAKSIDKVDAHGLTKTQKTYLVDRLEEAFKDNAYPSVIDVPGDGSFEVRTPQEASGLHQAITKEPLSPELKLRAKKEETGFTNKKADPIIAEADRAIKLYGHPAVAAERLRAQAESLRKLPEEQQFVDVDKLDSVIAELDSRSLTDEVYSEPALVKVPAETVDAAITKLQQDKKKEEAIAEAYKKKEEEDQAKYREIEASPRQSGKASTLKVLEQAYLHNRSMASNSYKKFDIIERNIASLQELQKSTASKQVAAKQAASAKPAATPAPVAQKSVEPAVAAAEPATDKLAQAKQEMDAAASEVESLGKQIETANANKMAGAVSNLSAQKLLAELNHSRKQATYQAMESIKPHEGESVEAHTVRVWEDAIRRFKEDNADLDYMGSNEPDGRAFIKELNKLNKETLAARDALEASEKSTQSLKAKAEAMIAKADETLAKNKGKGILGSNKGAVGILKGDKGGPDFKTDARTMGAYIRKSVGLIWLHGIKDVVIFRTFVEEHMPELVEYTNDLWEKTKAIAGIMPKHAQLLPKTYVPTKTMTAYKLFNKKVNAAGKVELYPLFIGATEVTPQNEWVGAESITKKGYAIHAGWHVGLTPQASHLLREDGTLDPKRVWAEVEIGNDIDWQPVADKLPLRHLGDILPRGGHYRYKVNANQGGEWIIAGELRVKRLLSLDNVEQIIRDLPTTKSAESLKAKAEAMIAKGQKMVDENKGKGTLGSKKGAIGHLKGDSGGFHPEADAEVIAGYVLIAAGHILNLKIKSVEAFRAFVEDKMPDLKDYVNDLWKQANDSLSKIAERAKVVPSEPNEGEQFDVTKHAGLYEKAINMAREAAGLEESVRHLPVSFEDALAEARGITDKKDFSIKDIINSMLHGKPTSQTESIVVLLHATKLGEQLDAALSEATDAIGTPKQSEKFAVTRDLQSQYDVATQAMRFAGSYAGRLLNGFKLIVNKDDYSIATLVMQAQIKKSETMRIEKESHWRDKNRHEPVTAEESKLTDTELAAIRKKADALEEAEKQLAAEIKRRDELVAAQAERHKAELAEMQKQLDEAKASATASHTKRKVTDIKDPAYGANNKVIKRDAYEAAMARLKEKLNRTNTGIPFDLVSDAAIIIGFHLEAGVIKGYDAIYKAVKNEFPTIPDADIAQAYEDVTHEKRNEAAQKRIKTTNAKKQAAIDAGKPILPTPPMIWDADTLVMADNLKKLTALYNQKFPKDSTSQAKEKMRLKIEQLKQDIADRVVNIQKATKTYDAETTALKSEIADLQKQKAKITGEEAAKTTTPSEKRAKLDAQAAKRINTQIAALTERLANKTPIEERLPFQPSDTYLLKRAQVEILKSEIDDMFPTPKQISLAAKIAEYLNLPRGMMTMGDLGHLLRQGGIAFTDEMLSHLWSLTTTAKLSRNRAWSKAAKKAWQLLLSDKTLKMSIAERRSHPNYAAQVAAGLWDARLDHSAQGQVEESYYGIAPLQRIPVMRNMVNAGERSFVEFGNTIRAELFNQIYDEFRGTHPLEDFTHVANLLNAESGRGSLGSFESAASSLASVFFAPRYFAAQVQAPMMMLRWGKDKRLASKIAAKHYAKYIGSMLLVTMLGAAGSGGDVEWDFRSSDFLKIKYGSNVRVDLFGGRFSWMRVLAQMLWTGIGPAISGDNLNYKSSSSGKLRNTRVWELAARFAQGKASPGLTLGISALEQKGFLGEQWSLLDLPRDVMPLFTQDVYEAFKEEGLATALAIAPLAYVGAGAQVYAPKTKPEAANTFGFPTLPGATKTRGKTLSAEQQILNAINR